MAKNRRAWGAQIQHALRFCAWPHRTGARIDAVGHVIINAILALLWRWTLSLYASAATTTRLILIGAVVWCFGTELTQQFVPNRGSSLLDLAANLLGGMIGLVAYGC